MNILEENEYYFVEDVGFWMIGKVSKGNNGDNTENSLRGGVYYSITSQNHLNGKSVWCYQDNGRTFRKATPEEIFWLETCAENGKFIKKSNINFTLMNKEPNYEIY